jgi:glucose/mannose transport system substrate-binding protein
MVIRAKAAMQFMGDWAKGEFTAAGKSARQGLRACPCPAPADVYLFNVDSFIMFEVKDPAAKAAQKGHGAPHSLAGFPGGVQRQQGLHPCGSGISEACRSTPWPSHP